MQNIIIFFMQLCFKYIFVAISIKIEKSKKNHALSHFDRLSWLEMLRHNTDFGLMRHILDLWASVGFLQTSCLFCRRSFVAVD